MEEIHQNNLRKINDATEKALTKHANKWAKDRVVTILQNLVMSNTISLEELTQLDIQTKTMSEICELITKTFGKSRLEHLDKNITSTLSSMDQGYEGESRIDLSRITRKELGKGSHGIVDAIKETENMKLSIQYMKKILKNNLTSNKI